MPENKVDLQTDSAVKAIRNLSEIVKQLVNSLDDVEEKNKTAFDGAESGSKKAKKAFDVTSLSVKQLEARLDRLKQGQKGVLNSLTPDATKIEKYNTAIAETESALSEIKKASPAVAVTGTAASQAATGFKVLGGAIKSAFLPLAAVAGLTAGAKALIQLSAEFEEAGDQLQSLTGLGDQEFEKLRQSATEAGLETTKSATEIINAYKRIGSDAPELLQSPEALAKVTREAVTLAEAMGGDVVEAARAVTGGINQFNLATTEGERIINAYAAGAQKGSAGINEIAETISKSGTTLAANNVSIEQAVALTETLAEKQIKGAEAGTNLRNITLKLANAGKGFVDGQFEIGAALDQTKAELEAIEDPIKRNQELTKLFGLESVTAGQILIDNVDSYREYELAVTGTNTATEQAEKNTSNLNGALDRFKATLRTVVSTQGEASGITRVLAVVVNVLRGGLLFINEILNETGRVFSEILDPIGETIDVITELLPAADEAGESFNLLKFAAEILLAPIRFVASAIGFLVTRFKEFIENNIGAQLLIVQLGNAFNSLKESIGDLPATFAGAVAGIKEYLSTIVENVKIAASNISGVFAAINIAELIKGDTSSIRNAIFNSKDFEDAGDNAGAAFKKAFESTKNKIEAQKAIAALNETEDEDSQSFTSGPTDDEIKKAEAAAKLAQQREKLRLETLKDGIDKEIALENFRFKNLEEKLIDFNLSTEGAFLEHQNNLLAIKLKANKDILDTETDRGKQAELILANTIQSINELEANLREVGGGDLTDDQTIQLLALRREAYKTNTDALKKIREDELKAEFKTIDELAEIEKLKIELGKGEELINTEEDKARKLLEIDKKVLEEKLKSLKASGEITELQTLQIEKQIQDINDSIASVGGEIKPFDVSDSLAGLFGFDGSDAEKISEGIDLFSSQLLGLFAEVNAARQEQIQQSIDLLDEELDAISESIDAKEDELAREIQLREDGDANRASIVQQELADLKANESEKTRLKKEALKEQQKAQKAALVQDTVVQLSSLITASANIFKGFSTAPLIGHVLAVASVAAMFAAFASAKSRAFSAVGKQQLREGGSGVFGGRTHEQGGNNFGGLETEKGEHYSVVSAKQTRKIGSTRLDKLHEIRNTWSGKAIDDLLDGTGVIRLKEESTKSADELSVFNQTMINFKQEKVDFSGLEKKFDKLTKEVKKLKRQREPAPGGYWEQKGTKKIFVHVD